LEGLRMENAGIFYGQWKIWTRNRSRSLTWVKLFSLENIYIHLTQMS
jgi:hypothetical protein